MRGRRVAPPPAPTARSSRWAPDAGAPPPPAPARSGRRRAPRSRAPRVPRIAGSRASSEACAPAISHDRPSQTRTVSAAGAGAALRLPSRCRSGDRRSPPRRPRFAPGPSRAPAPRGARALRCPKRSWILCRCSISRSRARERGAEQLRAPRPGPAGSTDAALGRLERLRLAAWLPIGGLDRDHTGVHARMAPSYRAGSAQARRCRRWTRSPTAPAPRRCARPAAASA